MAGPYGFVFNGKSSILNLPTGGVIDLATFALVQGAFKLTYITQQTTDNTVTTVHTVACPASRSVAAWVWSLANSADTSDDGVVGFMFNAVKNAAGTTAVVGSSGGSSVESGAGTPIATIVADDTADALLVRVLGETSKTYNWKILVLTAESD